MEEAISNYWIYSICCVNSGNKMQGGGDTDFSLPSQMSSLQNHALGAFNMQLGALCIVG